MPGKYDYLLKQDQSQGGKFDYLLKKKDISGSGDPALQSFEGQTPSQSTVSGEINVGDVPQVPVSKTPQVPGTGEIKEGVLTQPPKPKSPEELNLEMQSKVLGKDIPKDLVETAKITTDKSQLHNIAYALLKNNKTAAANAVSDIILQKFPDDSYAHQIKAHNFEVEKDYVNSAKELTQAIEKSPDDKSLYAKRALVARSAGMETTAKEDAQEYLRLAKLPNGDEDEALTRSNMYMLAGDEKQAQYWKKNYEGLVQDRQRGNTAQNLIGLHDWVLSGIEKISKPLQIPGDMIVEGVEKMVEGESVPKRISGLIDAGFGVLMATPAGVVFNSAITAGELVGAGEVTEWAFAPISKALNLAGIDEKQVGSILKAGLSPTAPISEKTANEWGDLAVQIGNLLPFMLFSHGTKYAKTADKLTKREPLDETDLKNVDEVIAFSAENPKSMNESVKLAEQFIKDKKDEKEVSDVQKSMATIPTYRIGSKLYPTPESFLKRLQDIKDKGVENINYEINLDPETSGKALDIFREKNTPTEPGPSEISDGVQQIKANDLKNKEEIKVDALKEPEQPPTLTEPTANVDKGSGIGEPAPIVPESISTPSQELPVNEKTGENLNQTIVEPIEFSKQLEQKHGVTVDLLGTLNSDRPLTLSKIEVPKETRMSGIGTAVMREIIDYADANDKKIVLTPSKDYGATSISRLKKFYKQFGFVENTGKNKDFSTKESMYRQPQPSGGGSQNVNPAIPTSKTGRKEVLSEQPQEGTTGAKSNPAVFTTPKGISIHNDKGLLVMFDKSGKEIPQVDRTVKKEIIVNGKKKITTTKFYNKQYREAKKEYLNGIEFDNGKEIDYFPDISESEADRFVLENTENPQHVLGVYERASMQNQAEKFGSMEWHIAEHLRFVTKESFDRWMSQNAYKDREDGLIQKVYFRSPKGKEQTQTLDQVAQSASAGFHGSVDNVERITPEMVGQFIIDYPGGTDKYYSAKSEIMTSAERKFTELTGLKIDKDLLQIAKNKLEAKRERNEWEKKHLRNVSPELRKTLDDPITLESLPLYREIFNKEEYKLIEEALKNEKINQGTEERPGGEESSQPIAMGEKSNTGILEQERQSRLAEIDSEIKRLNIEKKNESDRIDKENANIELPLDTPKQGELLNAEPKPIIADLSEYDSKIRALENERNTLISKEKQVAEADKAQGDLLNPTPDTVQSLQEDLAAKRITLPEYQKRIEQARRSNLRTEGSVQSRVPVSTTPSGNKIKASDIISSVEKALGIPIRIGKIRVPKYSGIYKVREEVIRLREANDLATMSHEIAHDIDKKTGLRSAQLSKSETIELQSLDYDPKKKRVNEGFAEFMRHYLTMDDASIVAPNFNNYFENTFLSNNPKYFKIINDAKLAITLWRNQGSLSRVLSQIDFSGDGPKNILSFKEIVKRTDAKIRSKATNRLFPLKYVVGEMLKQSGDIKLRPSEDPYEIAMATSKTAAASARQFVLSGTFNDALQKTGNSLKEIVTPIAHDIENALAYAYARRAINLHDRGINPGISREDANFVITNHFKPEYEQFTMDITKWSERIVDYLVDSGGFSHDGADRMRTLNPVYIMLKRSFIDNAKGSSSGKGFVDLPTPIKTIKGSGRDIEHPLKSMISQCEQIIGVANKARVARAIADMSEKYEGMGKWIEKLPPPMERKVVELERIKKQIEDAGGDLSQADMDAMITIFSQGKSYYGKDNIVALYRNEKREYYQLEPMLFDAMKGMDNITLPWFLNYTFGTASRLVRLGATGLRAGFSLISNPARDVATAGLQSDHGGGGRVDRIAKGIYDEILSKGKYINEYRRSGVEMSQPLGIDRKMMDGLLESALADNAQRKALGIVKHPIEAIRKILSVTEGGVRYAEFDAAMRKYEPLISKAQADGDLIELNKLYKDRAIEATNAANEVTVNFKRSGTYGAVLNQLIPFFNPAVQGLSRMGRTMYAHPVRSGMRAFAGLTAPSLALWWINKDEEWYKNLPLWQKYAFWNFKIGDTMIKIPRPFEWGYLFAAIPEGIANSIYEKDPKYFKQATWEAASNIPPSFIPGLVKPAAEVYFNWDIFRERPIVSKALEGLMPAQQYQSYTSELAKKAGEILNVSPLNIDHILSGYTGGLATDILNTIPKEYNEKADLPIIGRLFTRKNIVGFGGQNVQNFYDIYTKLNSIDKTLSNYNKNNKQINPLTIPQADTLIAKMKLAAFQVSLLPGMNVQFMDREKIKDSIPKNITQDDLDIYVYKELINSTAKVLTDLRNKQKMINKMDIDKDIKNKLNESINHAAAIYTEGVVNKIHSRPSVHR